METMQVEERAERQGLQDAGKAEGSGPCDEKEARELKAIEEELEGTSGGGGETDDAPCDPGDDDAAVGGAVAEDACPEDICPEDDQGRPRSSEITTRELGSRGEDAAAAYLERRGYRILERNWTCRFGEVDIIAADEDGTIVFIEVKTRRSVERGLPEEAITPEKQRRYEKIALLYMMEADWDDCVSIRFDAIGICVTGDFRAMLKHHKACFNDL